MDEKEILKTMKEIIAPLYERLDRIENRLENVELDIREIKVDIENGVMPVIQAIREGQRGYNEKFAGLEERTDEIEQEVIVLKVQGANVK